MGVRDRDAGYYGGVGDLAPVVQAQFKRGPFGHAPAPAHDTDSELVASSDFECCLKSLASSVPLCLLEEPHLGDCKKPDRLIAVAIVDVIRTPRSRVLKESRELIPKERAIHIV